MARPRRERQITALSLSVLVHAALAAIVARHIPPLLHELSPSGPPLAILPVVLAAPSHPAARGGNPPEPLRLHRRRMRGSRPEFVTPAPTPLPAPPAPPPAPTTSRPAPTPVGPSPDLQRALLSAPANCTERERLTPGQRAACDEALARLARAFRPAPVGVGLSPGRRNELDTAAARRQAALEAAERPTGGGALEAGSSGQPWQARPMPGPTRGPLKP